MKRIIFPLIITGSLGLVAISCGQKSQNTNEQTQETGTAAAAQDTSVASGYTSIETKGKKPPVKQLKTDAMRTVSMDGLDLEVTNMYAGSTLKQIYCKAIGREYEARYYFNSNGKVSMLDEISKSMSGEYIQEIFIYVADSLQVAVKRKAPSKAELEKGRAENFRPASNDMRASADKISKKALVLMVSED